MGKKGKKSGYADWEDDLGEDISGQNEYLDNTSQDSPQNDELAEKSENLAVSSEKTTSKKKKGKKNKGNKNQVSDDESQELESPQGPKELTAVTELDDDEFDYKPKKGKKGKKSKKVEEDDEPQEIESPQGPKELTAVTELDDDEFDYKPKKGKKGKKAQNNNESEAAAPPEIPEVRVKTKKEKEREKKEREKLRKKQQQAKKKGSTGEDTLASSEVSSEVDISTPAENDSSAKGKQAAGSKRKGPNVTALQKMLEEKRAREEEEQRIREEEARIAEEEKRLAEVEEARKEEARLKKKEKERKKKEEMKAQGKYLSKKQKEQQALAQRRLQQMLESGVRVAGLSNGEKKQKPVYTNKKKSNRSGTSSISSSGILESSPATSISVDEPQKDSKDDSEKVEKETEVERKEENEAEAEAVFDDWEAALEEPEVAENNEVVTEKKETDIKSDAVEHSIKDKEDSKTDKVDDIPQAAPAESNVSESDLRSPICCILGHVDTGKTKLLDNLRRSNVQEGEAGGITQQIGATYFPIESIKQKTKVVNKKGKLQYNIPGLLIIDTPGHESFTNLRSRGTSLCNIAILVIDIMHGLEPQTIESIRLLRDQKTPFVVALNKVDRLYGWHSIKDNAIQDSLSKQKKAIQREFRDRVESIILQLNEQGLNAALYFENKNLGRYVSLVPTSAQSGEGVPDLVALLISLTQTRMSDRIKYITTLECTVLEVKVIEGLGATIDVILSNGVLHEGDRIVLCGMGGPIITTVRALLTPQPLKEMRVKSAYVHHKEIKAAMGVKICANDLEKAVAGSRLLVVGPDDDEEDLAEEIMEDLENLLGRIDTSGIGVSVQASTLGSLEALLEFLKQMKIPVASVNIGPVYKKDVMRCATMLEKAKEYALMLCFDVKVDRDAEDLAEQLGVKIFSANVIYHLFDAFTAHQKKILEQKREESSDVAVFPCVLKTVAAFNKRDPIILGVDVVEGVLRINTPIVAVKQLPNGEPQIIELGRVASLEMNHKPVDKVKKGQAGAGVAMKLESSGSQILFGRQVTESDALYSHITRQSIDSLKDPAFRDEVSRDEWQLIIQLKKLFGII
ncbi:translation initiation factor eIF5B Tif52 [Schizosaccharomyces pombe]|uniref:Eukaryotic translation initiation factor 5B n=1 Tax=Schizosaccharomyces pombe (strain 972 / ATCC 24843) TaxID=284812 RepID=IF2P_SCHPO|nr:putative translation initiation factor IF2 [Schizosaccharomyces pombe]Q10251.1 RecName: Full=Eukaryotic translation initiation factor 5B; Short=eIF-5B; AltName: Full=Translation initiation factor IF-2 [Schizosaccharomyces pombe 972h-]CAA93574.1 translation initiation factor IF2 (predicted) [Schizosaccharomyces pombe]|eukprot:NP_593218.1 putative translation initiation factor IF2 [Schizosaccharomyces pombe]